MPDLKINGMPVTVETGATVLDAAEALGIEIPTLCHLKGAEPETSCMLCVVWDERAGRLIPSCSAKVEEGMEIDAERGEVQAARRAILNLLLSEHVGDCEAPCTRICPAGLDIPRMLRAIERGDLDSAAWIAQRDLALPVTLGHICPAPCEKGCRRGQLDEALKIRAAHRAVGAREVERLPTLDSGRRVAVIGSGAAGLACAWRLRLMGYACVVLDPAKYAGGALRNRDGLPLEALNAEIASLQDAGIGFRLGRPLVMQEIEAEFAGVVFASVELASPHFPDAFYAEEHKLAVKAVAHGKAAAVALDRFLRGEPPLGKRFDSRVGKLRESELQQLAGACSHFHKCGDLRAEAARCLRCDCRKPEGCKLRKYAGQYGADQRAIPADERGRVQLIGDTIVFEPGKCVKCGLCVKIARRGGAELGLAFVGRGYNTRVAVPFQKALEEGLGGAADEVVGACPTGALAFRDADEGVERKTR